MLIVIQGERARRTGDTAILDSVAGHGETVEALTAFLASTGDLRPGSESVLIEVDDELEGARG